MHAVKSENFSKSYYYYYAPCPAEQSVVPSQSLPFRGESCFPGNSTLVAALQNWLVALLPHLLLIFLHSYPGELFKNVYKCFKVCHVLRDM